jgi:rhamnulokinase
MAACQPPMHADRMTHEHVLAVDLGASSGRILSVSLDGDRLRSEEVHRFPNDPVLANGTLYWDALRLWHEIQLGIDRATKHAISLGIDAWGVDFAMLDAHGELVANPVHYRDDRTLGMMDWVFERVPRRAVFERTGIQFLQLNTLYQLASLIEKQSSALDRAAHLVSMPDLFNFWMTGNLVWEFTHATTTQFYNPRTQSWDGETLNTIGAPLEKLAQVTQPASQIGTYRGIPVILPAAHDTGSAVVAVPTESEDFAYVSSGTWSLIGLETTTPIINDAAYAASVTNEGGAFGTYRFLKNVAGLWLVQQSRATWKANGIDYSYEDLTRMALDAPPFRSLIDPDHADFFAPGDMPTRIRAYCERNQQPVPESPGQLMRTIYESLALKYRWALDAMIHASGKVVSRMHIIGGGAKNAVLCQFTADALNMPVYAGPSEATALGNAVVQLIALGRIESLAAARGYIRRSVDIDVYHSRHSSQWDDAYARFLLLLQSSQD